MKEEKKLTIKDMVKSVIPTDGGWSYSGPKKFNLARNLKDKHVLRDLIKSKVLEKFTLTDVQELEEYLKSKSFSNLIKKYEISIIDKQIENTFKNDAGLIIGCIVRNNPTKAVYELKRSVSQLLTTYLSMDERLVAKRLEERTDELLEKFSNPKPFSKDGYNPFEN